MKANPNPKYLYNFCSEDGVLNLPGPDIIPAIWHLPLMDSLARMCAQFNSHKGLNFDTYHFYEWPEMVNPMFGGPLFFFHGTSLMKGVRDRYDSVYSPLTGCTLKAACRIIYNHWNELSNKAMQGYIPADSELNFWESHTIAGKTAIVSICLAHPVECELLLSKLGLLA